MKINKPNTYNPPYQNEKTLQKTISAELALIKWFTNKIWKMRRLKLTHKYNPPYQNEKTLQITINAEKRIYVFITKLSAKRRNKNETHIHPSLPERKKLAKHDKCRTCFKKKFINKIWKMRRLKLTQTYSPPYLNEKTLQITINA